MDDKARRNLGAHYTSEANILKLIKPLFLDELHTEFERVKGHRNKLFEFHKKLRQLTFLDPACGCGNFLVICYRELRELELKVLRADHDLSAHKIQLGVDVHGLIGVNVDQFYGIEIEEFPAQIAQVALWLVDHQMNLRVSEEFGLYFARIPLKNTPHIQNDNALRVDWNDVLPAERCSYVLGNPPFKGKKEQSPQQKADFEPVMNPIKGFGILDFVCAWYVKSANYIRTVESPISPRVAFVSTNSITQGEQVGVLWSWMLAQGVHIQFAHRTFQWSNEAKGIAAVHCVIIGFGREDRPNKTIFEYADIKGKPLAVPAKKINPYLVDATNVALSKRSTPICNVPEMQYGSMANDDGHLLLDSKDKEQLERTHPEVFHLIRPFIGGQEFINAELRWCLWLKDANPSLIKSMPLVLDRINSVKKFRNQSNREATKKLADTPTLFGELRQPSTNYLLIPKVSSENRNYLPIGFMTPDVIANGSALIIPDAGLFEFGVLQSMMHMAWFKFFCGRLESRLQYSTGIIYNNFPWPGFAGESLIDKHRQAIEHAAQCVLDARAKFAGASLADLYDPRSMPPALLKAHHKLDTAVDAAYQPSGGKKTYASDAERVAFLFELYQRVTSLLPLPTTKKTIKARTIES